MNYIYELIDPRTGEVRYVGISNNPKMRYSHHLGCFDGGLEKNDWIKGLQSEGLNPTLNIREKQEDRLAALERERYWIMTYLGNGNDLVNVQYGHSSKTRYITTPRLTMQYVLDACRHTSHHATHTKSSNERYNNVEDKLTTLQYATIEAKPTYAIEELFDSLPLSLWQVAETLEVPEYTIVRFKKGESIAATRVRLFLRFLSWIYQTKFSLSNVTGIKVQETAKNILQSLMEEEI
jgi:hypothetical protein